MNPLFVMGIQGLDYAGSNSEGTRSREPHAHPGVFAKTFKLDGNK